MTKWKLVPESFVEWIKGVAQQEPEKPDYWSSCSQCQRNINDAEELLETTPQPPALTDERILEIAMSDAVSLIEDQGSGVRPRITVHNSIGGVYAFAHAIERELLGENE